MSYRTIDQTASEVALHRVLWLIKFLRALVLHTLLALVAAPLYFLAGISKISPLATDAFRSLRAQGPDGHLEGSPIAGPWGDTIMASLTMLIVLALVTWFYRSITSVSRRSLAFLAMLWLFVVLYSLPGGMRNVGFAFQNLDLQFAVLAALGVAMATIVVPLCVIVALITVARSQERSSFVATLDPRLAPGFWVYVNKLLDLPRTPLRTLRTAAAYALAFAGALLLIESMMYLLTVGSTSGKLATLAVACERLHMPPECFGVSSRWARDIPLFLLLATAGVKFAGLLQSTAKRLGGLSVSDVLKRPDDKFLLYLRPFDTDDVVLPTPRLPLLSRFLSFRPFPVRVEEELFDVADGYRPLIAVGNPGGSREVLGGQAYRTYLDDSKWQGYVADRIRRAERIVIVVKNSPGVRWELATIIREGATAKTLFLVDPGVRTSEEWRALATMVVPALENAGVAAAGFELQSHPIGFFVQNGTVVEIVNDNRTATSYRTAFSHFLAA